MKSIFYGLLLLVLASGSLFAAEENYAEFQRILDDQCGQCHTRLRIEDAIQQGADREAILAKMLRFGARLSEQERQVMGVFWNSTGEEARSAQAVAIDPLREYRDVLQRRCTGCHTLEIVEKALKEGQSIDELVEQMRQRGAIITPADKSVLGTFWGNPLKVQPE